MKNLKDKLNQGFSNFFSLQPVNIAIIICLFIILVLSYKTSSKIDLFGVGDSDSTETPTSIPVTTLSALEKQNKLFTSGNLLQEFIAKLNGQTFNANKFQTILNQRQEMINQIQNKQNNLKTTTNVAIDILNID
jgi:hypothetical protein